MNLIHHWVTIQEEDRNQIHWHYKLSKNNWLWKIYFTYICNYMKAKTVLKTNMLILYYLNSCNVSHASCVVKYTLISLSICISFTIFGSQSDSELQLHYIANAMQLIWNNSLCEIEYFLFRNKVIHPESITIYFWM